MFPARFQNPFSKVIIASRTYSRVESGLRLDSELRSSYRYARKNHAKVGLLRIYF
jgi:hypothetical protein